MTQTSRMPAPALSAAMPSAQGVRSSMQASCGCRTPRICLVSRNGISSGMGSTCTPVPKEYLYTQAGDQVKSAALQDMCHVSWRSKCSGMNSSCALGAKHTCTHMKMPALSLKRCYSQHHITVVNCGKYINDAYKCQHT